MKVITLAASLAAALAFTGHANATMITTVTASPTVLGNHTGATISRRVNDNILGSAANTARYLAIQFDESAYVALAQNPAATLTAARLTLNEAFDPNDDFPGPNRDGSNGSRSFTVEAFFSVEENRGYAIGDTSAEAPGGSDFSDSDFEGYFGNSSARAGVRGGAIRPGVTNVAAAHTDFSRVSGTFVAGAADSFTIDLSTGIPLAAIQTILADDDTSNAGIFLQGSLNPVAFNNVAPNRQDNANNIQQIFFNDDFELELTFEVVPEPGAGLLALMGLTFAGAVGMRRRLG